MTTRKCFDMVLLMKSAFSLVELSIVLVILGLLTGGILAGQSLIRASELRSVGTQYHGFVTATHSFRDKYFAWPGDYAQATDIWGAAHATPADCPTATGTGTQTCNGDGNGQVFTDAPAASNYGERYTFWQHLANAGLIEGSYSGRAGSSGIQHHTAQNTATGRLPNSLWLITHHYTSTALVFPAARPRHNYRLGGPTTAGWPAGRLLSPEEMWNIDTKLDDGRPALGTITGPLSSYVALPDCVTSDAVDATYKLTLRSKECIFIGAAGF